MSQWIWLTVVLLSAPQGEIGYLVRPNAGPAQIHVVSLSTGVTRTIGVDGARDTPRWSPDGLRVAYTVETPRGTGVYVAELNGPGGQYVGGAEADRHGPVWSSDGSRIAYTVGHGLEAQVAVFDFTTAVETVWGGGRTSLTSPVWASSRLVRLLIDPDRDLTPALPSAIPGAWNDSRELLIALGFAGSPGAMTTDLLVVSENDVTEIPLSNMPSDGDYAEFAPAAAADALAFESNDGGDREIFVITRRSTFDLSNHRAADWLPAWAPDGGAVAFQSFRSGRSGIYQCVPRRAGRVRSIVAESAGDCWAPAWSPDSQWIAYVGDAEGEPAVYVIQPDGSERQRISPPGISADVPAWRPVR